MKEIISARDFELKFIRDEGFSTIPIGVVRAAIDYREKLLQAYARYIIESLTERQISEGTTAFPEKANAEGGALWAREELLNRIK